jgi:cobalt-zinc-cadmium efflux system outer membrane protein
MSAAMAAVLVAVPLVSHAQVVLTLEDAIARARDQAGAVAIARARVTEAEASITTASARLRDNPVIELAAGPRRGSGTQTADVDIGFAQPFEIGGRRRARVDAATAAVARSEALVLRASRDAIFGAASAFLRAIAATERAGIAGEAEAVSRDFLAATERRYDAGDVPAIDLNLARIEGARFTAALRAAQADVLDNVGALRAILRLEADQPLELKGSLDAMPATAAESLRQSLLGRPELAALEAETREAEAELRFARALRRPGLGLRVGYEREADDTIVLGGLTVTLPVFQRGAGEMAAAAARRTRTRLELDLERQDALAKLDTAIAVHRERLQVAGALVAVALPSVIDNESLARRSYDVGELGLMDLLRIRRDALETRTTIVERRLEAAISRLQIDHLAGVLR